ncbi:MarR family winged helix-turn-helix transcriptional regulator [Sphingobacterium deserti]|nr:MarR family transcriptional regulator [Sphingobacterium deserti]
MRYRLFKDMVDLLEEFEQDASTVGSPVNIDEFKLWLAVKVGHEKVVEPEPDWAGKGQGRSADSVINTLFVHLNRYAKMYSKAAIQGSLFSTQEEFIYLINLRAFGAMTKMELIKLNIQEKPVGMQIISRLLQQGWVEQRTSSTDKRSKIITLTDTGLRVLDAQMPKIRQATQIVAGNLSHQEKLQLISLLHKLDNFHKPIFESKKDSMDLLDTVLQDYLTLKN